MSNPKRPNLAELLNPADETEGQGTEPVAEFIPAPALAPVHVLKTPARKSRREDTPAPTGEIDRVGLYLPKAVAKEIKFVAFTHDRKAHDIYLEAVDMVLKKYGRPSIRDLSGKTR
jgi:hypothetical protein